MKRFLIIAAFAAASCFAYSEVDPRTNSYNEFFEQKDYERALSIAENIIASFPDVIEFRREKAKMLAATSQKDKFMEEMLLIRNSPNPSNIKCFFDALSHDLVSKEFRDDLRRLVFQRNDTEILLSWPKFSTDKEIVVSKVYVSEEYQNENYSPISPTQSGFQTPDFRPTGEETKNNCIANMGTLTGAIEMYNIDHSWILTSIDSNTIPMLKAQGYLKKNLTLPTPQCSYYSHGDMSSLGIVACSVHGPRPEPGYLSQTNVSQTLIETHNKPQTKKQQHLTCLANIRVIYGATEMYHLDTSVPMQRLDLKLLYQKKILREIPLCPAGGFYQSRLDSEGELIISCSVHGGFD